MFIYENRVKYVQPPCLSLWIINLVVNEYQQRVTQTIYFLSSSLSE
jgi:hypothetical protein